MYYKYSQFSWISFFFTETVFNLMPFKSRWSPVENFIQLGGVIKCFQIIAIAYDWTFQGRSEMMRAALDVLSICSISPRAQLQFCERIEIPDNAKQVAFNLLLGACEGEFVHVSSENYRQFFSRVFIIYHNFRILRMYNAPH